MSEAENTPGVTGMLGAAGACPVVTWRGRPYKVGHPTQAAKSRLEELSAQAAVSRVEALQGKVKPATYEAMLSRVCDDVTRNHYATWGEGWQKVVWGDGGSLFLLSLLHEHHPELTAADASAMAAESGPQYRAALARVLPDFFDLLLSGAQLTRQQREQIRAATAAVMAALAPKEEAEAPPG